jgi:hypothetical protein
VQNNYTNPTAQTGIKKCYVFAQYSAVRLVHCNFVRQKLKLEVLVLYRRDKIGPYPEPVLPIFTVGELRVVVIM